MGPEVPTPLAHRTLLPPSGKWAPQPLMRNWLGSHPPFGISPNEVPKTLAELLCLGLGTVLFHRQVP